uniref:Putative translation initiation factor if-2 n=2 Tax=Ixodes ricinus TaxID=34613 RepID=A0A6B0VHH0_IXORI
MSGDTKRKNKNSASRPARSKASQERKFEGIYSNARFVQIAASLVGHVVQVQVRDGEIFEGVFRTLSPELEIVLEMAHPVERGLSPLGGPLSRLLASLGNNHPMAGLMIFRLGDVMSLVAPNADLDYATRDSFTDTAISKFNGQPLEKPLEPWLDGGLEGDALVLDDVAPDGDDTNGWDANEMFKTNAEKYGVTTSYDSALSGYTVKLEPKNTDEYKLQEAKACKIAQEIENNPVFKKRTDLENGDEEDKFSAVVRPSTDPSPPGARYVRRKPLGGPKPLRGTPPPPGGGLPRGGLPSFKGGPPLGSPSPAKTAPHPKHGPPAASQAPPGTHPFPDLDPASSPRVNGGGSLSSPGCRPNADPPVGSSDVPRDGRNAPKLDKEQVALADGPPCGSEEPVLSPVDHPGDKGAERKGGPPQKGRDQEIEEFKKFSTSIKLDDGSTREVREAEQEGEPRSKELDEAATAKEEADQLVRRSTLNPNAKEFVLNPNAKAFTPRTLLPLTSPPGVRLGQSSSPLVSHGQGMGPMQQGGPPPQQLVPGQHIITMTPQYLMQTTPVSVAQFAPSQGPRFRKAMPLVQARHDLPASMHVAAATGQPILAPAAMNNAPQLMVQYTPTQSMMHPSGPPQATVAYPQAQCFAPLAQMYPMMGHHRVMSPQPMGMVAATHTASYGDASHLPQLYMSHHAVMQGGQGGGGPPPHSSPPTPGGGSTPVGGQAPTPPVVYHQPPGQGGAGGGPQGSGGGPQPPLVLVPHSGGANTPPHLMPHSPMVPPQLATAHFVHHQDLWTGLSCHSPPWRLVPVSISGTRSNQRHSNVSRDCQAPGVPQAAATRSMKKSDDFR